MPFDNEKWIWQSPNYPNFLFNINDFKSLLDDIQANNKILNQIIANNSLSIDLLETEINSLTNEIVSSADIEGEVLKRESVRSSLKKKLDKKFDAFNDTHSTAQSDNYASILLDTNLNKSPLTIERLHGWHNCLFESGYSGLHKINVARFRDDEMQVVSGCVGCEKVHYEAPYAKDIEQNMQIFLQYCNDKSVNLYIKSAIAHLWFVIIHPYDDGNGRIARAIADFSLPNNNIKLYSLSTQISANKREYYEILEKTNTLNSKCDVSQWLEWHLNITNLAIKDGIDELNRLIFKTKFWDTFRDTHLNINQQKVLNKILDIGIERFKGNLNIKKYASIAKIDRATAQREIDELVKNGILLQQSLGSFALWQDTQNISHKDFAGFEYNNSSALNAIKDEECVKEQTRTQANSVESHNSSNKTKGQRI